MNMIKLLHQNHDSQLDCNEHNHNCSETLRLVRLALDHALSTDEENQLNQMLLDCPGCFDKFNIEKEFKLFLSTKIEKKCCSESLILKIKTQIAKA